MRPLTDLRAVLDAFAARQAAERVASGADKQPLLAAFWRLQQAAIGGDHRGMAAADRRLHETIVRLADVPGLEASWQAAADANEPFHRDTLARCWPDLTILFEAHRGFVDAILAGDALAAEDAARRHLDAVWYRLAEMGEAGSLPDDPLERACTYLELHLAEPVTLAFLAEHVARTSPGHLARLFRERRLTTFTRYQQNLRLQRAVALLTTTIEPIGRIATIVGYADASRFAGHFRRRYGHTPRVHRRRFAGRVG
jgi:AraC-like DNA-binding protein